MTFRNKVLASVYWFATGVTVDCALDFGMTGRTGEAIAAVAGAILCGLYAAAHMQGDDVQVVLGFEDQ